MWRHIDDGGGFFLFLHLFFFLSVYESWFLCSIICQAVCRLSVIAPLPREPGGRWRRGVLHDLEVGPGSAGSLWQRWRRGGGGRGEKLASSPHASLNRPTRLVAKSHQSSGEEGGWGKHVRKRKTRGDRRVGKKRGSWLVKWRLGAAGLMQEG